MFSSCCLIVYGGRSYFFMVVKSVRLDGRNVLAADYVKGKLKDFFHYPPFSPLHERLEYLHSRTFPRQELANLLIEMNEKWGASPRTFERIETFKREGAVRSEERRVGKESRVQGK